MKKYDHLSEATAVLMEYSTQHREQLCNADHWVGYSRAREILDELDRLMNYPRSLRMPNILVVGRSGNGKSSLMQRFLSRHTVQSDENGQAIVPILSTEVPGTPDESELWSAMLWSLGIGHNHKERASIKLTQPKNVLVLLRTRVLVLDEFNNITRAGKSAGDLLASIKNLSNELKVSVVAFGTQEAVNALNLDPQMKSRFEPAALGRWRHDKEYRRFLMTYERLLPMARPSNLADLHMSEQIYNMGGETIGGTVKLLKKAAAYAVREGVECINSEVLANVGWTKSGDWDAIARAV